MILNIVVVALILAITFLNSLFGLFSGLINLTCSIVAMCVAFGFAEPMTAWVIEQGLAPSYAPPVVLFGLFVLTLLVLRMAADHLLRGNVRVPANVDWIGGGVCGALIALINVGVLVLAFLLLPWGGRVAAFSRLDRTTEQDAEGRTRFVRRSVWLKPDEFVVAFFNRLSSGSLRYQVPFATVYPSFADWVSWSGNTVQSESATTPARGGNLGNGFGTQGVKVESWWRTADPIAARYRPDLPTKDETGKGPQPTEFKVPPGQEILGVRLKLQTGAADHDAKERFHRFRATMLRLVGRVNGEPRQYEARLLGGADPGATDYRLADPDNNFAIPATSNALLDALFVVDQGFQPSFVEYRRFARAPVGGEPVAKAPDLLIGPQRQGSGGGLRPGRPLGAMRFVDAVIEEGTGPKGTLPFPLAATAVAQAEVKNGKLEAGRISGNVKDLRAATGGISEIAPPEGMRVFQYRVRARRAASLAGQVFNFAAGTLNQYTTYGKLDAAYPLAGYYAIVDRGGEPFFELFLSGGETASAYRSMLDFQHIKLNELTTGDPELGLIFFVRPNEQLTRVENQNRHGVSFKMPGYSVP